MAKETKIIPQKVVMTNTQFKSMQTMVSNEMMTLHRELLNRLMNTQTDIDNACNYPVTLTISDYRTMYNRMGLAKRAVQIWPDECWQCFPEIYEEEGPEKTKFEEGWDYLETKLALFDYLHRIDVLSGIGDYGILLLGVDDGKPLNTPIEGIDEKTGEPINGAKEKKLLYLRAYDQSVVEITSSETDMRSPRYGMPKIYSIKFQESGSTGTVKNIAVHWTRVIHVADNRESSEVLGVSRLKGVYNNLLDIKKISGGSGEMFWKGGFPGYSFEMTPEANALGAELDTESVKEQMELWSKSLQRWIAITGVTAKSLAPQVADPTGHTDVHLKLVAVSLGVPFRVFLGAEEAKLASVQDKRSWNSRVAKRQHSYLSHLLIRPFIDRLISIGCLPMPKQYFVAWPDLNVSTEDEISKTALNRTEAFAQYVQGSVDQFIPPRQYLTEIQKMSAEAADNIIKESEKYEGQLKPEEPKPDTDVTGKGPRPKEV